MNKYKFGKIYRIISPSTDKIYIGSTTMPLCRRLQYHKTHYKRYLNGECNYVSSFEIVKYDDYKIELICDYPCNSRTELERKEGDIQREQTCINKRIAGRTYKEYYDENNEELLKYQKKYRDNNRDEIKEQRKKYREKNKDEIIKYKKIYYENNKDEINKKKGMKITCDCGSVFRKSDKAKHNKSKKHINFVESSSSS
jgi:hypothetical protein